MTECWTYYGKSIKVRKKILKQMSDLIKAAKETHLVAILHQVNRNGYYTHQTKGEQSQ